ncbi:hypothetical protein [Methanolapillus millepedarum]
MNPDYVAELRGDRRENSQDDYYEIKTRRLIEEYNKHAPLLNIEIRKTDFLLNF